MQSETVQEKTVNQMPTGVEALSEAIKIEIAKTQRDYGIAKEKENQITSARKNKTTFHGNELRNIERKAELAEKRATAVFVRLQKLEIALSLCNARLVDCNTHKPIGFDVHLGVAGWLYRQVVAASIGCEAKPFSGQLQDMIAGEIGLLYRANLIDKETRDQIFEQCPALPDENEEPFKIVQGCYEI